MKILTVDDSKIIRKVVASTIEALGYETLMACHGREALEVLEKHPDEVGLVLLDWNMPVMDGLACLKAIRADERFRTIPVMMLTTESEGARIAAAIRAGATHYLTKPFSPEALSTHILECLGQGGEPA